MFFFALYAAYGLGEFGSLPAHKAQLIPTR
jgi:hypothetical protein